MRDGPKPLMFQLSMASLASAGLAGGTAFDEATLQNFFVGIKKYQAHPFKRDVAPLDVVWKEGEARLLRSSSPAQNYKTPILLLPSMINKSDILDLLPGRSLLRWLAGHGFEAYLFDWGNPVEDEGQADFDTALETRLLPALEAIGRPVIVLGYCMGGLFSAALCALHPDKIKAQMMLATPWNFHTGQAYLKNRLSILSPAASVYMAQNSRLPDGFMQAVFASLDPEGTIKKFASFAKDAPDDKEQVFVAVEDWLNDGVDLPSGIAKTCLHSWYEQNQPFTGDWHVCGKSVAAADIHIPTLVIAAQNDRIVPPESATAFADQNKNAKSLICRTGHVGLLAGTKAVEEVWKPIADFCASQQ